MSGLVIILFVSIGILLILIGATIAKQMIERRRRAASSAGGERRRGFGNDLTHE
jgi:hypothetical protein